jgi:hypothetical protein
MRLGLATDHNFPKQTQETMAANERVGTNCRTGFGSLIQLSMSIIYRSTNPKKPSI